MVALNVPSKPVDGPIAAEARLQVTRVREAPVTHEGQHLGCKPGGGLQAYLIGRVQAGMEQVPGLRGHEAIRVNKILLQPQQPEGSGRGRRRGSRAPGGAG